MKTDWTAKKLPFADEVIVVLRSQIRFIENHITELQNRRASLRRVLDIAEREKNG